MYVYFSIILQHHCDVFEFEIVIILILAQSCVSERSPIIIFPPLSVCRSIV